MTYQPDEAVIRSATYELLASAFLYPEPGSVAALAIGARQLADGANRVPWEVRAEIGELSRGLAEVDDDDLVAQYVVVFGHTASTDCPPYESEYDQAHVFQKSQTLAELQEFYNAFGVVANPELKERPDHISVELEFMHMLALKEAHARRESHGSKNIGLCRQAQERFLALHLSTWASSFADRLVEKKGSDTVYAKAATLMKAHLETELTVFHLDPVHSASPEEVEPPDGPEECEIGEASAEALSEAMIR